MKWMTVPILLIMINLISCSEQYQFTDKKNLNNILNKLSKGEFYTCNFKSSFSSGHKNYKDEKIVKKLPFEKNKNINLIYTEEKIGLIYKNDKWGNGNSIFNKKTEHEYVLGSSYIDSDFTDQIINTRYKLKFNKKNLRVNLFDENIINEYSCKELHNILTEAMKKQLLQNFLLQSNKDRL